MKVYSFSEQSYPDAWFEDAESLRVSLPNQHCDPEIASRLYNRYLDEWMLADELGLNIIVNEHHATATCMSASVHLTLAILARQTKRARLLGLGTPIANRNDPLRVAEEMSIIDVISRGRLEMGFIKGVPYEIVPANAKPVHVMDRFWEAHDLILKAMTTHDGPFSWEGEHFQYRSVNIWPRPYQQPHPPVWSSSSSPGSSRALGGRGYVIATVMTGYRAKAVFRRISQWLEKRGAFAARPPRPLRLYGVCRGGEKRGGGITPRRAGQELSADQHAGGRAVQESTRLHGRERRRQAVSTRGLARPLSPDDDEGRQAAR